jgi:hypothetical protein
VFETTGAQKDVSSESEIRCSGPTIPRCAALAPDLAGDDTASQVLREVERSPQAFGESFGDMAPPLPLQSTPLQDLLKGRRAS